MSDDASEGRLSAPRNLPQAPRNCPVCAHGLAISQLDCAECGTQISGHFAPSPYERLNAADHALLRVFLVSRGNMKDVERFLNVSYPTARVRFAELLTRLGFDEPTTSDVPAESTRSRADVLASLAAGDVSVEEASEWLSKR